MVKLRCPTSEGGFHGEGRVCNTNVTPTNPALALCYEYNIKDHLGNTRLMFTFGMRLGYAWMDDAGLDNRYQYNGKELN